MLIGNLIKNKSAYTKLQINIFFKKHIILQNKNVYFCNNSIFTSVTIQVINIKIRVINHTGKYNRIIMAAINNGSF